MPDEDGGYLVPEFWADALGQFAEGRITVNELRARISAGLGPYARPRPLRTRVRLWLAGYLWEAARWLDPSIDEDA